MQNCEFLKMNLKKEVDMKGPSGMALGVGSPRHNLTEAIKIELCQDAINT